MKNEPIEAKLSALGALDTSTPEGLKQIAKALSDRSNLVVKRAARIVAEGKLAGLLDDLRRAFDRFLENPTTDKGCDALNALVIALVELDDDEPDAFLAGIKHVQMEPVWGGRVDVAAELRANSAIGLVNTRHPDKLNALVDLLADPEWRARAGAVRALGANGSEAAILLIRYKALIGDVEREVLLDCFSALLQLDDANIPFVASFLHTAKEIETVEAAILALGGSRHESALEALRRKLAEPRLGLLRRTLLIAIASMRLEAAVALVKGLAAEEDQEAADVLRELRIEQ